MGGLRMELEIFHLASHICDTLAHTSWCSLETVKNKYRIVFITYIIVVFRFQLKIRGHKALSKWTYVPFHHY